MNTFDCRSLKNCAGCTGCPGPESELVFSPDEVKILSMLSEVPWLPAAKKQGKIIFRELTDSDGGIYVNALEQKGLIELDFDKPLNGCMYEKYSDCSVFGSFGLTQAGVRYLDALEIQGVSEE